MSTASDDAAADAAGCELELGFGFDVEFFTIADPAGFTAFDEGAGVAEFAALAAAGSTCALVSAAIGAAA
jgi:hypothetical protein